MTLEVPFEGFVDAAKRHASGQMAFVTPESGGTRVSCANPAQGLRVVAFVAKDSKVVGEELRKAGLEASEGRWIPDDAPTGSGDVHVAAVAYRTEHSQPGLWVDAYADAPTAVHAIKTMYDEFRESGQIAEVSLEEFVRLAEPTVVVLSPSDLRGFASAKDC